MTISKVSIIIPVFKVKHYLSECLDSVLAQTYTEWECILVDDGSSDGSGAICDEYAASEPRFKVIHQQNSGASIARNTGIENSSGEWIVFVDSDDIVRPDYLQNMIFAAQTQDADFVIGGLQYWHTETGERNDKRYTPHMYKGEDIVKAYLLDHIHQNGGPVAKLYRREIINEHHAEFNPKMHYAEDCNFMMTYINHISSIAFIDAIDYIYRLLPTSLSHRRMSLESEKVVLEEMSKRVNEISLRFSDYDLTSMKGSILQYYGRVVMAITDSALSSLAKYNEYRKLSALCRLYLSTPAFLSYVPYCLHEKLMLRLLHGGHAMALHLYAAVLYPFISRCRRLYYKY